MHSLYTYEYLVFDTPHFFETGKLYNYILSDTLFELAQEFAIDSVMDVSFRNPDKFSIFPDCEIGSVISARPFSSSTSLSP